MNAWMQNTLSATLEEGEESAESKKLSNVRVTTGTLTVLPNTDLERRIYIQHNELCFVLFLSNHFARSIRGWGVECCRLSS